MTDGTFLSRAWPSIVALVGTVAVVVGLLLMFGDDNNGDTTVGDTSADESDDGAGDADDTGGSGDGDPGDGDSGEGGDDETPDDGTDSEGDPDPDAPPPTPVEAPPELRTPVGILNSTDVTGLAAGAQERFIDGGWDVPATTNYSGEIEGTTAYYPSDDLRASAEALSAQFPEIRFVKPTPAGSNLATDRILVVLAEDYAAAVGAADESG